MRNLWKDRETTKKGGESRRTSAEGAKIEVQLLVEGTFLGSPHLGTVMESRTSRSKNGVCTILVTSDCYFSTLLKSTQLKST